MQDLYEQVQALNIICFSPLKTSIVQPLCPSCPSFSSYLSNGFDQVIIQIAQIFLKKDYKQNDVTNSASNVFKPKCEISQTLTEQTQNQPLLQSKSDNFEDQIEEASSDYDQNEKISPAEKYCNKKVFLRKYFSEKVEKKKICKKRIPFVLDLGQVDDLREIKNIPKNYAKAIINFILKRPEMCSKVLAKDKISHFLEYLRTQRKITNLKQFNKLIVVHNDPQKRVFNSAFRKLSQYFLKHDAVNYIFHSKIVQIGWHLKYRNNLLTAISSAKIENKQ